MTPKNILVVDDEKVVHLIFKTVLTDRYHLFFAENAQEGIDILSEHPIHLVLLDIRMPEISGIELLESIVVDTAMNRIPVIIMTAEGSMDAEIKARRLGAVHFLEKADLFYEKKNILNLVEKFISQEDHKAFVRYDFKQTFRSILTILIATAEKGDFVLTAKKLGEGLFRMYEIHIFTIWIPRNSGLKPEIRLVNGKYDNSDRIYSIPPGSDQHSGRMNKPYLNNKAVNENPSRDDEDDDKIGYMSEIGIPLFEINSEELSRNQWKIPAGTISYGFVTLKRNRVFSTKEYKMLTRFITHTGAILYEFFKDEVCSRERNGVD